MSCSTCRRIGQALVSGRSADEILKGLRLPSGTVAGGAPGGSPGDIPLPLTAAWRQFVETWGDGEVVDVGSSLQVGGQVAIVVNLETLLGIGGGGGQLIPGYTGVEVDFTVPASGTLNFQIPPGDLPPGAQSVRPSHIQFNDPRRGATTDRPTVFTLEFQDDNENEGRYQFEVEVGSSVQPSSPYTTYYRPVSGSGGVRVAYAAIAHNWRSPGATWGIRLFDNNVITNPVRASGHFWFDVFTLSSPQEVK